ncbi:hypothetical protein HDV04_002741 [Boothiomyces sp. JEL0838]|nr:hypothetical protein HDV04_002741 [Boothiomyces sp. JEL0838]
MENDTTIINDPDQDITSLKNFELRRELLSDSEKENEPVECIQKNNCKKPKLDQLQDLPSQSDTRSQSGVTEISNTVPDYQRIESAMEVDVIDWSRGKANGVNLIGHLLDNLENPVKMHRDTSPKKLVQSRIPENPFQSKFNKNIERNRPNDNIVLKKLVQPNTRVTKNRQERHEYSVPSQFEDRSQPKINEIFKRKTTDFYSSYRSIKRNHPQKIDPYNSQQISNETYGKLIGTVEFGGKEQLSVLSINRELYLVNMERVKESFNSTEPSILENLNTNDTCPHGKQLMIKL